MRLGSWLLRVFFVAILLIGIAVSPSKHKNMARALNSIGESIYLYHKEIGRWPTEAGYIRTEPERRMVQHGTIVVVWHVNLRSDPKQNSGAILAYQAKGLRTWLGFTYVCWGDLRTEIMTQWQLRRALDSQMER